MKTMPADVKLLLEDALKLPPEARAALAGTLLEGLGESTDEPTEAAWASEIKKRLVQLDSKTSRTVPWPKARRQILGN